MTTHVRSADPVDEVFAMALALAGAGYALTPVRINVAANGKKEPRPCLKGWQASSDVEVLRDWFVQYRPNVWAQVCRDNGVDVVDLDPGAVAGDGTLTWLASGLPTSAMVVDTPSGGVHHLWREDVGRPLGVSAGRMPGVDTRSSSTGTQGGISFIVGVLSDGRMWKPRVIVPVAGLATTPASVVERLSDPKRSGPDGPARDSSGTPDPFATPGRVFTRSQALKYWGDQLAEIEAIAHIQGARHQTLVKVSRALGVFEGAVPGIREATWGRLRKALDGQRGVDIAAAERTFGDLWRAATDRAQVIDDPPEDPFGVPGVPERPGTGERLVDQVLRGGQLRAMPAPRPLIAGVLGQASLALLTGMNQSYKSFVALDWACSIATGRDWLGHAVRRSGPVLYVAAEGANGVRKRALAWARARDLADVPNEFLLLPRPVQFRDSAGQAELTDLVADLGAVMVVIDTVHQSSAGLNENDSGDMSVVMAAARKLTSSGATVLLVHHTGHEGLRARGSSSLTDDADEAWTVWRDPVEQSPGLDCERVLRHSKSKDTELHAEIVLAAAVTSTGTVDADGDPETSLTLSELKSDAADGIAWKSHEHACALLDAGMVNRAWGKGRLRDWMDENHSGVKFQRRDAFWSAVAKHYRVCQAIHVEFITSVPDGGVPGDLDGDSEK